MSTQQGINSLINANSVEALKNQLIPLLTDINDNTGGGGVQSVTGNVVDDTDPQNPVVDVNIDPNTALLIEVTRAEIIGLFPSFDINPKACYRITDSAAGIIRVWGKSATELTATAMLEGADSGTGSITNGQWGNYDLDGDVFTPTATSGSFTPSFTAGSTLDSVTAYADFNYIKIGNIVSITGYLNAVSTDPSTTCSFLLALPVNLQPNNDFSSFYEATAVLQQTNDFATATISAGANVSSKNISFSLTRASDFTFDITFTLTYSIDN